jgi:transcriptional regulator with XRE-family HTH domain
MDEMSDPRTPIDQVLVKHGLTAEAFCERLGLSPDTLRKWRKGLRAMSYRLAIRCEEEFGIPRHELRPDIFPARRPPARQPRKALSPST